MRRIGLWSALTVSAILWTGSATLAQKPKTVVLRQNEVAKVRVEKEVDYDMVDGGSLKLDLYRPATDGAIPHPGLIFVHGGGWSGGDKSEYMGKAQEMAEHGYVAITVNYRLAPKYHYPAAVEDVQAAVRWLRSHAIEYHLDPNRIGAVGSSAGGHLVSMLGVTDTRSEPQLAGQPSSRVNCVVDYFGRMDLTLEPTNHKFTEYRIAFIGKPKMEAMDLYEEASPVRHVDAQTVPFLLIHGWQDTQVEPVQSFRMFEALQKAKIECSLLVLGNAGHGFGGVPGEDAWSAARAFLDRHLHPTGQ
ncbi:MAG TPA: alpha/beta hydrolase [Chthonomonadaceae bacterium]|nr:alpha/beta hydrolase [Chthonomonadaceae bacterium]